MIRNAYSQTSMSVEFDISHKIAIKNDISSILKWGPFFKGDPVFKGDLKFLERKGFINGGLGFGISVLFEKNRLPFQNIIHAQI